MVYLLGFFRRAILEKCDIPLPIIELQRIDFHKSREQGFNDLVDALQLIEKSSQVRKDIFSKLCAYHKGGNFQNMTVSRVINWVGHNYKEENIREELLRMEQDKIIKLDNSDTIGPATEITLLTTHY